MSAKQKFIYFVVVVTFGLFVTACGFISDDEDENGNGSTQNGAIEIRCSSTEDCMRKLEEAKANRQKSSDSERPPRCDLNKDDCIKEMLDYWAAKQHATPTAAKTDGKKTTNGKRPDVVSNFDLRGKRDSFTHNSWNVQTYEGVTDQMVGWFKNPVLKELAPQLWPTWPNTPNPLVPEFRVVLCKDMPNQPSNVDPNAKCVPDGMYYGLDERNLFGNDIGDLQIQARGYHLITCDYDVGFASHFAGDDGLGSALLVLNVGNVTANFEDVYGDNCFSVADKYFNGDTLWWGIWGLTSHTTAAMLNYRVIADARTGQILNSGDDGVNSGANCSVAEGCRGVHFTVAVTSGNHVVLIAKTTFVKR